MASSVIDDRRQSWLRGGPAGDDQTENDGPKADGDFVLYWMQQAQRSEHNHALERAIQLANEQAKPLAVVFCLVADYPEASLRHFAFMLEGLAETATALEGRGIAFEVLIGSPGEVIGALGGRISTLVMDRGYLPIQRGWYDDVLAAYGGPVLQVETDVVVPVELASDKLESAARTLRPKIHKHLEDFLVELATTSVDITSNRGGDNAVSLSRSARVGSAAIDQFDLDNWQAVLDKLGVASEPEPVEGWTGGTAQAKARLDAFVDDVLPDYGELRNRYDHDHSSSELSPYLHYGQISPVAVALAAVDSNAPDDEIDEFIEELVVRRELAMNLAHHGGESITRFGGLPDWARESLADHADDERNVYTAAELEAGETDDEIWNAIMDQMRTEGWVHNQLRMYWGKQILYWTNTPEYAFRTLLALNNRYFLDGRDPNSYTNVAWCFGRHDRGFAERDVMGKVRPFTDAALKRKGDLDAWLESRGTD